MMFRPLKGFKAQYHDLTLLVAADFDEYRVLLRTSGGIVQGRRQFNEAQAKEHARSMAASYIQEKFPEEGALATVDWVPFGTEEWLSWSP